MDISQWLIDISWPVVSRILAALGLGTVTYTGAEAALSGALDSAKASIVGLPSEVMQILAMSGFFEVMSITAGGLVSGLAWMVLKRFALQTTGPT